MPAPEYQLSQKSRKPVPDLPVTYSEVNGVKSAGIKPGPDHFGLSNEGSLLDIVKAEIASGTVGFSIDMSELTALNSAGIGILIGCRKEILANNGNLRLLNVPDKISEILRLTRIDSLFEMQ